jgi:hypothetical protein
MAPKLALRVEEQGRGIIAHGDAVAERGGFRERGGGTEEPERNAGGALAQMQDGAMASVRAEPEHRGDLLFVLA